MTSLENPLSLPHHSILINKTRKMNACNCNTIDDFASMKRKISQISFCYVNRLARGEHFNYKQFKITMSYLQLSLVQYVSVNLVSHGQLLFLKAITNSEKEIQNEIKLIYQQQNLVFRVSQVSLFVLCSCENY